MLSLLRKRPQMKIQNARYRAHKIPTTDRHSSQTKISARSIISLLPTDSFPSDLFRYVFTENILYALLCTSPSVFYAPSV
jgi:hypothetical protein